MLIISFLVSVYYNTLIAWVLYYLFESFRSDVPWRNCCLTPDMAAARRERCITCRPDLSCAISSSVPFTQLLLSTIVAGTPETVEPAGTSWEAGVAGRGAGGGGRLTGCRGPRGRTKR